MEAGEKSNSKTSQLSNNPCTIKSLAVECSHGRKAFRGKLQVVAKQTSKRIVSSDQLGVEVELKKEYGGEDTLTATVEVMDGSGSKQACCGETEGEGGWKGSPAELKVKAPPYLEDDWPMSARPATFIITGRGCDECTRTVKVEVFPSENYSGTLTVKPHHDLLMEMADALDGFIKLLCSTTPATVHWKKTGPKGMATWRWGWKEDEENWKAYFLFAGEFGLDPLFVLGVDVEVSLLAAAGMVVGIPPGIMKIVGKHLADILVNIAADIEGSLTGSLEARHYSVGEPQARNTAVFVVTGTGKVEVSVQGGSDYLLSFKLTGGGEAGIEGKAGLEVRSTGIFFTPSAKMLPLEAYLIVKTRAFLFWGHEDEIGRWPLWKGHTFYSGGAKKLWPPEKDDKKKKGIKGHSRGKR